MILTLTLIIYILIFLILMPPIPPELMGDVFSLHLKLGGRIYMAPSLHF